MTGILYTVITFYSIGNRNTFYMIRYTWQSSIIVASSHEMKLEGENYLIATTRHNSDFHAITAISNLTLSPVCRGTT
jgi:hypothetical protein